LQVAKLSIYLVKTPNYTDWDTHSFLYYGKSYKEVFNISFPGAKKLHIKYSNRLNQPDNLTVGNSYYAIGEYTLDNFPKDSATRFDYTVGVIRELTIEDADTISIYGDNGAIGAYIQVGFYMEITGYDEAGYPVSGTNPTLTRPEEITVANLYSPTEMDEAIYPLISTDAYKSVFDATVVEIKEASLEGITKIGDYRGYGLRQLEKLELPDSITLIERYAFSGCSILKSVKMPRNNSLRLDNYVFGDCLSLREITLYETPPTVTDSSFDTRHLKTIWVPGESYDAYLQAPQFKDKYKDLLKPHNNYVGPLKGGAVAFNTPNNFFAELISFDAPPASYSVVVEDASLASISDIVLNADSITFNVNDKGVEGTTKVILTVETVGGTIFTREREFRVFAVMPESTYTVETVEGAAYGFALNDAGYYESQCQGVASGYALCRVNISNLAGKTVYFDCINFGEQNYDYGFLSYVNTDLLVSSTTDSENVYHNFKTENSADVVVVEYNDAINDCYIIVKYRKDGSGNKNNDSLQFKVRFGE
jgi:hypothetical protein